MRRGAPGALAWLFPTPEEPARVTPGTMLEVRVRLPTALTPPPGVQQPQALARWAGALIAPAKPLEPADAGEVRYALAVMDVRPDAGSTLAYRATLPLPAWIAPGAYALTLVTPGGALDPTRVHVLDPDARSEASRDGVGTSARFVVASGRASVSVQGGRVAWYPAGALDASEAPPVVGVVREASGATATLRSRGAPAFAPTLRLPPGGRARAGEAVELAVEGLDAGTRVAWRIGGRSVAWGPSRIAHAFVGGGREEVIAFAVGADGRGALLRGSVRVDAAAGPGCALVGARHRGAGPTWALAFVLVLVSKSARRLRGWNRLRRGCR